MLPLSQVSPTGSEVVCLVLSRPRVPQRQETEDRTCSFKARSSSPDLSHRKGFTPRAEVRSGGKGGGGREVLMKA